MGTQEDYNMLGQRTEGFSGSDINGIVRDALMEPVRTMQSATHFIRCPNPDTGAMGLAPCSPGVQGAIPMTLMQIPANERALVMVPKLDMGHFLRVLNTARPSVGQEDIQRHVAWTDKF